jgi:hypothetical protein
MPPAQHRLDLATKRFWSVGEQTRWPAKRIPPDPPGQLKAKPAAAVQPGASADSSSVLRNPEVPGDTS